MNVIKSFKNFGFKHTAGIIFNKILFKLTKKQKFRENIFALNLKYLNRQYAKFLVDNQHEQLIAENAPIFIFWWQGYNAQMPEIVKACIQAAKTNNPTKKIIFVTKDNFRKLVNIPNYILEKLNNGTITITHFSDILRASLLVERGGVYGLMQHYIAYPH